MDVNFSLNNIKQVILKEAAIIKKAHSNFMNSSENTIYTQYSYLIYTISIFIISSLFSYKTLYNLYMKN